MNCPRCKNKTSTVISAAPDTRTARYRPYTRRMKLELKHDEFYFRSRVCKACGNTFETIELEVSRVTTKKLDLDDLQRYIEQVRAIANQFKDSQIAIRELKGEKE